jgi:hypothetical protein
MRIEFAVLGETMMDQLAAATRWAHAGWTGSLDKSRHANQLSIVAVCPAIGHPALRLSDVWRSGSVVVLDPTGNNSWR